MDKILTIRTFKSGHIYFSSRYQDSTLRETFTEARTLYATIKDLPIIPQYASFLEEELVKRSIFGTAAIEGNPLSEEKIKRIIEKTPDTSGSMGQFEQEIRNLNEAYNNYVIRCKKNVMPAYLTEDNITEIHRIVTNKIDYEHNVPGHYRNERVQVGDKEHGGVYTPPKVLDDIRILMKAFVDWINSDELLRLEPIIRAALAHYYLGLIHPFRDGNGRTARIIEAYLLTCSGYRYVPVMLSNFYYKNIDKYFLAFSVTEKNKDHDLTYFLEFVTGGFVESLKEIKDRIIFMIRKLALKDYYSFLKERSEINQRQCDLLSILLARPAAFSFRDLFENPVFSILFRNVVDRTAKRDLKKLCGMNLLTYQDDKYLLNFKVLDPFSNIP